jgi:lipoyl(octanoyl) transferase
MTDACDLPRHPISPAWHEELRATWLGRVPYDEAHALQERLRDALIVKQTGPTLLLVEHDPVLTFGRRGESGELKRSLAEIEAQGIAVRQTARGGRATFHGLGQLVGYPIVRLRSVAANVPSYVCAIEEGIIQTLAALGIHAERSEGQPGVWVGGEKIASVGIAVTHGVAWHGFAINVGADLSGFDALRPCGLDIQVTSIARQVRKPGPRTGHEPSLEHVAEMVAIHLADDLGLQPVYRRGSVQDFLESKAS